MSTDEPTGQGGTNARKAARSGSPNTGRRGGKRSGGASVPAEAKAPGASPRKGAGGVRRQLDPDALAALEEERDFLLHSLSDLEREHDAGDVDDTDYAELKDDYTARAAGVLRAIDDRRALAASTGSARSWGRTAGVLSIVAVLALGVGWFVFRDAGTRAPGQGLSGDARQDSANLILQAQTSTGQAQGALQEGDAQKALDFFEQAIKSYDEALKLSPSNVEAMTYRAWVLHTIAVNSDASRLGPARSAGPAVARPGHHHRSDLRRCPRVPGDPAAQRR